MGSLKVGCLGCQICETARTTREIVANVRLSDMRVVHHDNHSIFRGEIQKNASSGGRIPFSYKVALEFTENVGQCPHSMPLQSAVRSRRKMEMSALCDLCLPREDYFQVTPEPAADPPAPFKFAMTCAGISACAPSWDQRQRPKDPLQLNGCCEMVASYCSPAAEELLRCTPLARTLPR